MEEICKQLDSVLVEVMGALKELSQLRERYSEVVREVSSLKILKVYLFISRKLYLSHHICKGLASNAS